jgi:hypothetical protein
VRSKQIHPDPPHLLTIAVTLMILGLICLGLVFAAGCASSTTGKSLNVAVIGSGIADLVTTRDAINSGRGREANVLMGQGVWQQTAIKALGIGAVLAGTQVIEKSKPMVAHLLRGITIGVWTGLAIHNAQIGRTR